MTTPLWMQAMQSYETCRMLLARIKRATAESGKKLWTMFNTAHSLMVEHIAVPYAWSSETTTAARMIGEQIPDDAQLAPWNLGTTSMYWWFEIPLDIVTARSTAGVKALTMGWRVGTTGGSAHDGHYFIVEVWGDDLRRSLDIPVILTASWSWRAGETLKAMLERIDREYQLRYTPGQPDPDDAGYVNEEQDRVLFMRSAEQLGRFILGAQLWLNQRIFQQTPHAPERHTRKRYERETGRTCPVVQLIQLRKVEHTSEPGGEGKHVEWAHRWIVGGHVRNQPVGPGRKERKLIWIGPYIKGPDDKPLSAARRKVFQVER